MIEPMRSTAGHRARLLACLPVLAVVAVAALAIGEVRTGLAADSRLHPGDAAVFRTSATGPTQLCIRNESVREWGRATLERALPVGDAPRAGPGVETVPVAPAGTPCHSRDRSWPYMRITNTGTTTLQVWVR